MSWGRAANLELLLVHGLAGALHDGDEVADDVLKHLDLCDVSKGTHTNICRLVGRASQKLTLNKDFALLAEFLRLLQLLRLEQTDLRELIEVDALRRLDGDFVRHCCQRAKTS